MHKDSTNKIILKDSKNKQTIYHFSLSLAPAENVDDFRTSPISSLQKLKLFIVHM